MPFMSLRLLDALQQQRKVIHTALDDLESFLWLLIWCIVQASKDVEGAKKVNQGLEPMLKAWSSDYVTDHIYKGRIAQFEWRDAVFGDFIEEWFAISRKAEKENRRITKVMSRMHLDSQEWEDACSEIESYCEGVYKEVLESGFKCLEGVRKCSGWDDVVAANIKRMIDEDAMVL
jgi:hypothetical protein